MKLREFTEEGNQKFILLYQKIKASVQQKKSIEKGYTSNFQKQMEDLVQDNNLSKELSVSNSKDLKFQEFENQFAFGKYIFELLKNHNETMINNNDKLWNWLSAFFFNIVFHKKARGISEHRYILSEDWFTKFRHLVRTPWYMYRIYKDSSKLFLSVPTYTGSDYMEQWISHRITERYYRAGDIAFELYYDKINRETKSGWSKKYVQKKISGSQKKIKKLIPGSIGRLIDKLNQYNEIYDIWEMDTKDIIKLLPKEFDELKV